MDARKLKFTCCAKWLLLGLFITSGAQAQFIAPSVGGNSYNGFNDSQATEGPTSTPTWDNSIPTNTPTMTPTYNPFATATWTGTPGSPTDTITPTFTPTQTGTIYTPTPTWSSTPNISRASLVLLPTAYSNAKDHWDGFNWDIDFTYFIGSIVSQDYTRAPNGFDSLEQINIVLLTSDWKYGWLDDSGEKPGIASGVMFSFLAQVGSGNSAPPSSGVTTTTNAPPPTSGSTSQAFQVSGNAIGGIYTVISKTVAKDTAVHFGYIYGLQDLLGLSMNYTSLLPYFGPGLEDSILTEGPDSLWYMGFNTHFLDRNWKFEIWKPYPMDHSPILMNTLIDGLPMAFNIGYERWDTGFAVIGYVNFRIPLLPSDAPY